MRIVGTPVVRVEDRRVLRGAGHYVDDVRLPGMLHAAFVRSPFAHAEITAIDATAARAAHGVVAVFTGDDIRAITKPVPLIDMQICKVPSFHALATDRVRFVGDPVAVVVATDRYLAEDACELVDVSYAELDVVTTADAALAPGAPVLFDDLDDNVLAADGMTIGDVDAVFAAAELVVPLTLRQHRVSPAPIECRGTVAHCDAATGELTVRSNIQHPHGFKLALAQTLRMAAEQIRVLTPDIGGAFGLKGTFGREDFCVAAIARALHCPVKWIEDRYEHLVAGGHAREESVELELAVRRDGTLLAMRASLVLLEGAYPKAPFPASVVTSGIGSLLPGPYRWQAYEYRRRTVVTNKGPYVSYRGPWAMETWARERALDEVARELGLDPAEIRRRNLVAGEPDDRLITGRSLAGVTNRAALDRALEHLEYDAFRSEQAVARAAGRHIGVGMATFIEAAPGPVEQRAGGGQFGGEQARVRLESDGHVTVVTSQTPGGQGHETTLAQVAADELGVPFGHVKVVHGDTRLTPYKFIGTGGSMSATWARGAVESATRRIKEMVLAIAAAMLEVGVDDLEIVDGVVTPRGVPARGLSLADLALQVVMNPVRLPGVDRVLEAHEVFTGEAITGPGWSGGAHVCTVEVDVDTGHVRILRYVVVEDCGKVINPAMVEGQVRGGVAQAIGQVLYERVAYDGAGNILTSTFVDYLLPTAAEVPPIEVEHLETIPSEGPDYRGVGEGGLIVAPAAITNAVADALASVGVRVHEQSLPPSRVLELLATAPQS